MVKTGLSLYIQKIKITSTQETRSKKHRFSYTCMCIRTLGQHCFLVNAFCIELFHFSSVWSWSLRTYISRCFESVAIKFSVSFLRHNFLFVFHLYSFSFFILHSFYLFIKYVLISCAASNHFSPLWALFLYKRLY
jgi:hypothetical protein